MENMKCLELKVMKKRVYIIYRKKFKFWNWINMSSKKLIIMKNLKISLKKGHYLLIGNK